MNQINVTDFVAKSRFTGFNIFLLCVGIVCVFFDGYDTAVFGAILPPMMKEWSLTPVQAGALGSYALFGMMFGAFGFGVLADAFGRRRMVGVTFTMFSLFTMLCGVAPSPTSFGIFRFLAGAGLAGILPNIIALVTEYSPIKSRTTIAAAMFVGYSVGGLVAPLLAIGFMQDMGWRFIMIVAGAPLVLLPFVYKRIPESAFILLRDGREDEMRAILRRIDPAAAVAPDVPMYEERKRTMKVPVADLFAENRALSSVMFTTAIFFHLILGYGLITWLPKLMVELGYEQKSSLMFMVVLQIGAMIGTVSMGWLGDKFPLKRILIGMYLMGSITMALFAVNRDPFWAYVLIALAGVPVVGAQNLVQVYMSQFYPTFARSTALGFSSSIGRFGGMLGPLLAGWLVAAHYAIYDMFYVFAIPGLCSTIAIAIVQQRYADKSGKPEAGAMPGH